ncbi:7282_t:CDS:1, partial [Dentiscutata erythropus]
EAINEFKKTIVYLIQCQLSNHSSLVGSRCITIPCLESQFVGVFGKYIARYALTQQTYECVFTGEYAYETLQSIFGDNNWGIRHYTGNQQTAVILFTPTQTDQEIDDNIKDSGCNTFSQDQDVAKFEMKVKWEQRGIKDIINHKSTRGFLILRFTTDMAFFNHFNFQLFLVYRFFILLIKDSL